MFVAFIANAQQFVYQYKNAETNYTDNYILAIENKTSYFTEKNAILNREYLKTAYLTGHIDMNNMKRNSQMSITSQRVNNSTYVYKSFGASILLVLPNNNFKWTLHNDKKQTDGKILHKATIHYGGRDWVAWYNMEVPLQEGPYVFAGLPGLIEQVYDTDNIHSFTLKGHTSKTFPTEFFKVENPSTFTKTSVEDFLLLVEEAKKDPTTFLDTHSNILTMANVEITPEMKKAYNEKTRKKLENYIIERAEPSN